MLLQEAGADAVFGRDGLRRRHPGGGETLPRIFFAEISAWFVPHALCRRCSQTGGSLPRPRRSLRSEATAEKRLRSQPQPCRTMQQRARRQTTEKNRLGTCTDLPSPAVDELVTLRNLLRKPTGIELSQLNQGDTKKKGGEQGAAVGGDAHANAIHKLVHKDHFQGETRAVDMDKHMYAPALTQDGLYRVGNAQAEVGRQGRHVERRDPKAHGRPGRRALPSRGKVPQAAA